MQPHEIWPSSSNRPARKTRGRKIGRVAMTNEDRDRLGEELRATIRRLLEQIKESESLVDSGREHIVKTKRMLHDVDVKNSCKRYVRFDLAQAAAATAGFAICWA